MPVTFRYEKALHITPYWILQRSQEYISAFQILQQQSVSSVLANSICVNWRTRELHLDITFHGYPFSSVIELEWRASNRKDG